MQKYSIYRLGLYVIGFFFLIGLSPPPRFYINSAQSSSGITVDANLVEADFPNAVVFQLEASSPALIDEISLEYGTEQLTCSETVSKTRPDFDMGNEVVVNWTWDFYQTGPPPPGAVVWWRWQIKDRQGNSTFTPRETITLIDSDFTWRERRSDEMVLYSAVADANLNDDLWQTANDALDLLEADFEVRPEDVVYLYNYPTIQDMQDAVIFTHDWTGGLAIPDYKTILVGINRDNLAWGKRTITHELTHIVVHQVTFNCVGSLPRWLDEGLASYMEGSLEDSQETLFDDAVSDDSLMSLQRISSGFPTSGKQASLAYAQSYYIVSYLIETYGSDKMGDLLHTFKGGRTPDQAIQDVYGVDVLTLDNDWRVSLGLFPREVMATQTPIPIPTLLPFGSGTVTAIGSALTTTATITASRQLVTPTIIAALPTQVATAQPAPPSSVETSPANTSSLNLGQNMWLWGIIGGVFLLIGLIGVALVWRYN